MNPTARSLALVALAAVTGFSACAPRVEEPAQVTAAQRIESPGLGIALASVPAPFEVVTNRGTDLVLSARSEAGSEGRLVFGVGPVESSGINLVAAVKTRQEAFEAAPEGVYHGNVELGSPIGTAFTSRGSYTGEDGERVEEAWIYALHPTANRLLTLTFTYPPGEWQERVQQLLAVMGEIEALGSSPAGDDAGGAS